LSVDNGAEFGAEKKVETVVIGAGPAGLTAAYLLAKKGRSVWVLEADSKYVGGISKTARYKDFLFDIGGHRFFSKSQQVEDFWTEILGKDLLHRPRSSRIYYKNKLFAYPLNATEALRKLGLVESLLCILSYFRAKLLPIRPVVSFRDWVTNQFGRRLFRIFFETYTEKVWGMRCEEISADWAAQRIRGLSLGAAIRNAFFKTKSRNPSGDRSGIVKTLIDSFRYPRQGPGMMWEECARRTQSLGAKILMGARVNRLEYQEASRTWTIYFQTQANGKEESLIADHLISSAPISELGQFLKPQISLKTYEATQTLRYRDFLIAVLILKDRQLFPDNWIYIHDPHVKVGRIQNFKSWSAEMVPDPTLCSYGLEYFCSEGDELWDRPDIQLLEMAKTELEKLSLAQAAEILDGCIVRQKKAYPVYDKNYFTCVQVIKSELQARFPSLHLVGRNGLHRYNNQDHSMMTAMLTVENILKGEKVYDVWMVNEDAEYHEDGKAGENSQWIGLRSVPKSVADFTSENRVAADLRRSNKA